MEHPHALPFPLVAAAVLASCAGTVWLRRHSRVALDSAGTALVEHDAPRHPSPAAQEAPLALACVQTLAGPAQRSSPHRAAADMKLALSATNPCHMYEMALALYKREALAAYLSGYPSWKLCPPERFPLHTHSWRTLVTYALHRLPSSVRPQMLPIFYWQDRHFDSWVAQALDAPDALLALPGQAEASFLRAKEKKCTTILSHASGPLRQQFAMLRTAYAAAGKTSPEHTDIGQKLLEQHRREYELAEIHLVASSVVRQQLLAEGIAADRILVVPYGADPGIFYARTPSQRTDTLTLLFAGQVSLRKNLVCILEAMHQARDRRWRLVVCGPLLDETRQQRQQFGHLDIVWHGPVSRKALAEHMRRADVLVLPSLEEGFGLVVPQALSCGLPCLVSDKVGAKDLIRHRENGSILPATQTAAWIEELRWWETQPRPKAEDHSWERCADMLLRQLQIASEKTHRHPPAPQASFS